MTADIVGSGMTSVTREDIAAPRSGLRALVIAAGIGWAILFVAVGLADELALYGDGAIFSYSVAVADGWAFHWHNIANRLTVYVFCHLPAELYVALSGDARGGIVIYALLFFGAPLVGLIATYAADRTKGRVIFTAACFSTAVLCPLVFGFPTEMWVAHAVFWPALAVCHGARAGRGGAALVFTALLALVFSHEGGVILAGAILAALLARGPRDAAFRRGGIACIFVMAIWVAVTLSFPPDDYIAPVLERAALHVFDPELLTGALVLLLAGALAGYAIVLLALRRMRVGKAEIVAVAIVATALAVYWLWFDHALHAENRYYLRTVVLLATPPLGLWAALRAVAADGGRLRLPIRWHPPALFASDAATRAAAGAFLLVTLVHAAETAKFVGAWSDYKAAVRALAIGAASDPRLGDPRFVSSERIDAGLNRLAWSSTTPFLSALVAPGFASSRLVVDPQANYFWLSCATATASEETGRAIPASTRALIRRHACLHR
jgi:hypothetical protein